MGRARLYIINPQLGAPTHFEAEVLAHEGYPAAAFMAALALPTLAACVPDDYPVELCDERISPADLNHPAEHVWLTCNSRQYDRIRFLGEHYRKQGKTVTVGGPFATLSPEAVRPYCDVLFKNELENAAAQFFLDARAGTLKEEYDGKWADMERSPVPRWDLYPNDRAMIGAVQTSRGCPYDCNFCEVIQVYGRVPRLKTIPQVLRELEEVYRVGYRTVFLTDDNFTAIPARAKDLLRAIETWNRAKGDDSMQFYTQITMTAAKDPEILDLCARAGLVHVYIGVESPDEASLREASKRPNLRLDISKALRAFHEHGIGVIGSMIAGFDTDHLDVFARYEQFVAEIPIPLAQIGPLVLTRGTPLHAKMQAAGRLSWDGLVTNLPFITNLQPLNMTREQLLDGLRGLSDRLYDGDAFAARLKAFLARGRGAKNALYPRKAGRRFSAVKDGMRLVQDRLKNDPALAAVARVADAAVRARPDLEDFLFLQLFEFLQMRLVFRRDRVAVGTVPRATTSGDSGR